MTQQIIETIFYNLFEWVIIITLTLFCIGFLTRLMR
jgi:hypothetical protein